MISLEDWIAIGLKESDYIADVTSIDVRLFHHRTVSLYIVSMEKNPQYRDLFGVLIFDTIGLFKTRDLAQKAIAHLVLHGAIFLGES